MLCAAYVFLCCTDASAPKVHYFETSAPDFIFRLQVCFSYKHYIQQQFCIQILWMIRKSARAEDLGTDDRQQEALGGHAVVSKKAAHGKRERCQHAHPADLRRADERFQAEVRADRHADGEQRKHHLPQG